MKIRADKTSVVVDSLKFAQTDAFTNGLQGGTNGNIFLIYFCIITADK